MTAQVVRTELQSVAAELETPVSAFVQNFLDEPRGAYYLTEREGADQGISWTFLRCGEGLEFGFRFFCQTTNDTVFLPGMQDLMLAGILQRKRPAQSDNSVFQFVEQLECQARVRCWHFQLPQPIGSHAGDFLFELVAGSVEVAQQVFEVLGYCSRGRSRLPAIREQHSFRIILSQSDVDRIATGLRFYRFGDIEAEITLPDGSRLSGVIKCSQEGSYFLCEEKKMAQEVAEHRDRNVRSERLDLAVELGDLEIPIADAQNIRPGDTVQFAIPSSLSVVLRLGNNRWATGSLTLKGESCSIEIERLCCLS